MKPKDAVASLLSALQAEIIQPAPDGWLTVKELTSASGLPDRTMRNKIDVGLAAGKIQGKVFRPRSGGRAAMHYHV
jgi:predicted transcriptional regulator